MGVPWPFVGRAGELTQLGRALDDPSTPSVVICGRPGVGKTRLAAEALRARDGTTHQVLDFSTVQDRLRDLPRPRNRRLVLWVDDGHLLDEESASDLLRTVRAGQAVALVVLGAGRVTPRPLSTLCTDQLAPRLDLAPLDRAAVADLLQAHLRGPVDGATAADLTHRCRGDLHLLREITTGALETGALTRVSGVWRLLADPTPSQRLIDFIGHRLGYLRPEHLSALQVVAFAGRATATELAGLMGAEVLEELESDGLLDTRVRNGEIEIRIAHPAYVDVLVAGVKPLRRRRLARQLCEVLSRSERLTDDDVLRAARWRLAAGEEAPEQMLAAARIALGQAEFAVAEQLARAAARPDQGLEAPLLAARLASMQGRAAQAETELARLTAAAADNEQRQAIARARVDTQLFFLGLGREGLRLAAEYEQVLDSHWQDAVDAARAATLLRDEGPAAAASAAESLLASARGRGLVLTRLITAYGYSRVGKLRSAIEVARAGRQAAATS